MEILESTDEDETEDIPSENAESQHSSLIKMMVMFILLWQSIFKIANVAVEVLLKFMKMIIPFLMDDDADDKKGFPNTLLQAHKLLQLDRDDFQTLVVCPKCDTTYQKQDCLDGTRIKLCSYVEFPLHPWANKRKPCLAPLLKRVKTCKNKDKFIPYKVYCYQSIIETLKKLVRSKEFVENCFHWRQRLVLNDTLCYIYDGKIWNTLKDCNGQLFFFSDHLHIGLLLNVDWYQPFDHTMYSVGVIFLAILNLPKELRYRPENVILCGIIPGPHEPQLTINSYLEPLVEELHKLWKGVDMHCEGKRMLVKAALICVSCDTPAARKTGGFLGHAATKGCFKCFKSFPTSNFAEKPNYGGFDRSTWRPRTNDTHHSAALKVKNAKTQAEKIKLEQAEGIRFGELTRLPYFDSISFFSVDPMHNLLLGSAKHMLKLCKSCNTLTTERLFCIQSCVNSFITPTNIGRIPLKIESGFCGFTADQWKHWVIIYSLVCMKKYLTESEYSCWQKYVQAVSLFCSRIITHRNVDIADELIHGFCLKFEELYGSEKCTPNMHLHCHMSESIKNFGPSSTFWLFAFERINGILGKFHTNHHSIETQLMRKFITNQQNSTSISISRNK